MTEKTSAIDLPEGLLAWVESTAEARVVSASRHFSGASREAWSVDVRSDAGTRPLFLLKDKGEGRGSVRDAAILRALVGSGIPVPHVVGLYRSDPTMILLERLSGRSDFPAVDRESEREPTARHLMQLTGRLHALEIGKLSIAHLEIPKLPEDCARPSLVQARGACRVLGDAVDPFLVFALDWLEENVPLESARYALVHSDMGPGNFLYQGGRVTGLVDWEVAHFGDPMEDLAAISVRDMATPIGHLPTRFREYESASGIPVDLDRVHYYRALVLVRNSLMIGLGLAHPAEGFDVVEMTMYQTLLMRAAALVVCDNLGIARPSVEESLPRFDDPGASGGEEDVTRQSMLTAMRRDLTQTISPAVRDSRDVRAERAYSSVLRGLETLAHEDRVGREIELRERSELADLLGRESSGEGRNLRSLELELRLDLDRLERGAEGRTRAACYFARRMHRLAERRRPLMAALYERLPQPLEDA